MYKSFRLIFANQNLFYVKSHNRLTFNKKEQNKSKPKLIKGLMINALINGINQILKPNIMHLNLPTDLKKIKLIHLKNKDQ